MRYGRSSSPCRSHPGTQARGMVLLVVLVVIALLALAALGFSEWMLSEREAAELSLRQVQARACADSGLEMARAFLSQDRQIQDEAGGWYDNPEQFRGVLVRDGLLPRDRGRFSIVAPPPGKTGRLSGISLRAGRRIRPVESQYPPLGRPRAGRLRPPDSDGPAPA